MSGFSRRRRLAFAFYLSVATLFLVLAFSIGTMLQKRDVFAKRIATLPKFSFAPVDSNILVPNLAPNGALWLIFIQSDCDYCVAELENITRSKDLNGITIWLVSSEPREVLKAFSVKHSLASVPNLLLLMDTDNTASRQLSVSSLPSSFLYGSDKRLIKRYQGIIDVETVLSDLNSQVSDRRPYEKYD